MKNLEKLKLESNADSILETLKRFGKLYLTAPLGSAERQFYKFTYRKFKRKYSN